MLVDAHLKTVEQYFKYRKLIKYAVEEIREQQNSRKKYDAPRDRKRKADPTANTAICQASPIKSVVIYPKGVEGGITVQQPEKWLKIINQTYRLYQNQPISIAVQEQMERRLRQEVASGLMGIARQTYWQKRRAFFIDAAFLAQKENLL